MRRWAAGLALLAVLTGCGAPSAARMTDRPTAQPTMSPTARPAPSPTAVPSPGSSVRYPVVRLGDPRLPRHTILRPRVATPFLLPVVVWGNGGCRTSNQEHTTFLTGLASLGYLVIAYGAPGTPFDPDQPEPATERPEAMVAAIDWAVAENARPAGALHGRVDTRRVVVMGASCGAAEALVASRDRRVTATLAFSHGGATHGLHAPVLLWTGGAGDGGGFSARVSYDALTVPAVLVDRSDAGHLGPWHDPALTAAALDLTRAWLALTLYGDPRARAALIGPRCGLCGARTWTVRSKNWT